MVGRVQLQRAISRATDFLYHNQLPYGEFRTFAAADEKMQGQCHFDSSPFATSIILYAISFWHDQKVQEMTTKALDFLTAEMEGPGLWRYWSTRNDLRFSLPPDLDDMCCISYILKKNHRPLPPNTKFVLANRNEEGLFFTWLAPRPTSPLDLKEKIARLVNVEAILTLGLWGMADNVDPAVNANVLLYLGENEDTKPAIDFLIDLVVHEEGGYNSYYPDRLSLYYMLSRAAFNGVASLEKTAIPITNRVTSTQDNEGSFGSELLTALAICTLLNLNQPVPGRAIEHLLETQKETGAWPRIPMFLGPAPYYGSEELTTALCLEALARYWGRDP